MERNNAVTCISIEGELSIFTAESVRQQLLDAIAIGKQVQVDLSRVSEIDSAGLQLMVAAKHEAAARNSILHFGAHSEAVVDLLDLCDFGAPLDRVPCDRVA